MLVLSACIRGKVLLMEVWQVVNINQEMDGIKRLLYETLHATGARFMQLTID